MKNFVLFVCLKEISNKMSNGYVIFTNNSTTLERRNSTASQTDEGNVIQSENVISDNCDAKIKGESDNCAIKAKNKMAPKLPPRSDSLNSLNKRPLPPTPQVYEYVFVI